MNPQTPAVSVVIPARNEAPALPATLRSVIDGLPAGGEVIVVDGASTDATAAVAAAAGAQVIRAGAPGRGPQLAAPQSSFHFFLPALPVE